MKKYVLLTFFLLPVVLLSAQQTDRTYRNGKDSLVFSNDRVMFRISDFGGLSTAQVGEGNYELVDNFMLVHTSEYTGNKSNFQSLKGSKKDTCMVKVISSSRYPVQGILVESKNGSDKVIGAKVTDREGKIYLTDQDKTKTIAVSAMGYNAIVFDYTPGRDYLVSMAENDVIENRTVAFRLNRIDDETISVLLLTDDLDRSKDLHHELRKLEKKAHKNNLLEKRFKKESVAFY